MSITAEQVRSLLIYDPQTGVFRNRIGRGHNAKVGDISGTAHKEGYWCISIANHKYLAHRLAYLYVTGEWPKGQLDHKDLNRQNNSWENLRPATQTDQEMNKLLRANNKTGVRGVCWVPLRGKYLAQFTYNGKKLLHRYYTTLEEAAVAYKTAASLTSSSFLRA